MGEKKISTGVAVIFLTIAGLLDIFEVIANFFEAGAIVILGWLVGTGIGVSAVVAMAIAAESFFFLCLLQGYLIIKGERSVAPIATNIIGFMVGLVPGLGALPEKLLTTLIIITIVNKTIDKAINVASKIPGGKKIIKRAIELEEAA